MKKGKESRISTGEWLFILFIVVFIDLVQLLFNLFAIGILINRLVNFVVGVTLPLYFSLRGVKMLNWKRAITALSGFIIEIIPVIDILPAWTMEVLLTWYTVTHDKRLLEATKAAATAGAFPRRSGRSNQSDDADDYDLVNTTYNPPPQPLNQDGVRQPHIQPRPLNYEGVREPQATKNIDRKLKVDLPAPPSTGKNS